MHAEMISEQPQGAPGLAERAVLRLAARIAAGRLTVRLPDGSAACFKGARPGPDAELQVVRPRLFRRLLAGGSLGLAEAYIDGDWDAPDLAAVLELGARNLDPLGEALGGRPLARLAHRLVHALRRNSRPGARRNIAAHYDLGNSFYAAWLDPTMTYSAALFARPDEDLEAAQLRKYRRMAQIAGIEPGHTVLEIGCGWGGFSLWAARTLGCRVTAITISQAQLEHVRDAVAAAGLEDRIEVRSQDYRDVVGSFDRIVSIEMLEAVGEAWWPTYFDRLHRLLRPGGRAAVQVITIADASFPAYRRQVDFVQRYVFPGGMLPSPAVLRRLAAEAGLEWGCAHAHGDDYARTLAVWRERFERTAARGAALALDARFVRLWRYYLAYCEAGFRAGRVDLMQIGLVRAEEASR